MPEIDILEQLNGPSRLWRPVGVEAEAEASGRDLFGGNLFAALRSSPRHYEAPAWPETVGRDGRPGSVGAEPRTAPH